MANVIPRASRLVLLCLFSLALARTVAQGTNGGCSITLLSDSSTLSQYWCLETPVATIEPVVWLIDGTGVEVEGLPPGVTAVLSNDTLIIAGTITGEGLNTLQVTTSEGCSTWLFTMDMSVIVDPQFSCTVDEESVILSWPGINSTLEYGDDLFVLCTSADGFFDVLSLFLPCPDHWVWNGLPTNTELTFLLSGNGAPYCFPGGYETMCTIVTTGMEEQAEHVVRVTCTGERLDISALNELREVRIYDMLGAQVLSRTVRASTASIRTASLGAGAYVLRAVGADGTVFTQRFVKN